MSEERKVPLPEVRPWPRPITVEEYRAYAPEKLELVDGYLMGGPDGQDRRLELLALLLANCGLEAAVFMAHADHVREAVERSHGSLYE